jgi:hypothetical protein
VTKRELLALVRAMRSLRYGWDRRDALPPRPDAISTAIAVLGSARIKLDGVPEVRVQAMPGGSIDVLFSGRDPRPKSYRNRHPKPRVDLVASFVCDGHMEALQCSNDLVISESLTTSVDEAITLISEFIESIPPEG